MLPKNKILSLKPGTKYLAISVLENYDLLCWKNKKIREIGMPASQMLKRLRVVLTELIDFWSPRVIAIEDTVYPQSKKSSILDIVCKEIKSIGREKKLKVYFYSPLSVRKFICQNERPTKMNTARILATSCYPWLYRYYEKEESKSWWEAKYGLRIFDAIAIGIFCLHKLKIKKK